MAGVEIIFHFSQFLLFRSKILAQITFSSYITKKKKILTQERAKRQQRISIKLFNISDNQQYVNKYSYFGSA